MHLTRQRKSLLCLYCLAGAVGAAELDPTFGETMLATTRIAFNKGGANDDVPTAIAVDENGRLLVSGSVENATRKENIGVAALDAEGHLDAITTIESASYQTFSHDVIPVAGGICTVGSRDAMDASASCWSDLTTPYQFGIAPDVDRWVSASPATASDFPGVFYVLGEGYEPDGEEKGFYIRRAVRGFDGSVTWDPTFAQGSLQVTHHVPGYPTPPVEITSNGGLRVLVGETSDGKSYVVGYSAAGDKQWWHEFYSTDGETLGKALAGTAQRSIAGWDVKYLKDGVMKYRSGLAAIDASGGLDVSFNTLSDGLKEGFVALSFTTGEHVAVGQEHVLDVAIDDSDRIYALGNYVSVNGQLRSVVVRLLSDGAPDETWAPEGRFELPDIYKNSVAMVLQQEIPVIAFTFDNDVNSGTDFGVVRIRESAAQPLPDAIFRDGFEGVAAVP